MAGSGFFLGAIVGILGGMAASGGGADSGPYFPPRAFALTGPGGDPNDFGGSLDSWFSAALKRMGEPSLWGASRGDKALVAFRVLWLPTWGHPVAVRVERAGGGALVTFVRLDGAGGYDPGKVALRGQVRVDRSAWERLNAAARRGDFWRQPTLSNRRGMDGEEFVVEGVDGGRYRVVDRWTPEPGTFLELCGVAFDLTGADLGRKDWAPAPPAGSASRWPTAVALGAWAAGLLAALVKRLWPTGRRPR